MNTEQLYSLIDSPVVTEKSAGAEALGQYTFKVLPAADKKKIKEAIQIAFGVDVITVRTLNMKGKTKRTKFGLGQRKSWKKAIVTIMPGQRIDYGNIV